MKHDQKCRALKMVLSTLQTAIATNQPQPADAGQASGAALSESQVASALASVNLVLNDKDAVTANVSLSPVDIAQLVLQILQLILSHLPGSTAAPTPSPAPAPVPAPTPAPAIDATGVIDIAETIMEVLELLLSKLTTSATAKPAVESPALSPIDIAGLVLEVIQLLLSKFATPAPTAPAPAAPSAS